MSQAELFPAIPREVSLQIAIAFGDPSLSPCARAVLQRLMFEPAAGRAHALQIRHMQARWRVLGGKVFSDRDVKAAVKELLEERGVGIGASRSGDRGYFLLVSPEDVTAAERPLEAEIRSLARRLRAINPKSEISRVLCGQLGLEAKS